MRKPTRDRPRRSELATPASNEHMCEVAARAGADMVFLDLEDACAPAAKESARATAVAALTATRLGRHHPRDPDQRARHQVVLRRYRRGRHRGTRCTGRHHHPESAQRARGLVGRCAAHPAGGTAGADATHRARGPHRGGRGTAQRPGDCEVQPAARVHHLRSWRPVRLTAVPRRRQLPTGRRVPRRLLACGAGAGAGRRPRRRHRRDRRALPRLSGRGRLPAGGDARQPAWASTASGRSTPTRCRSPTRSSRRLPRNSPKPAPS